MIKRCIQKVSFLVFRKTTDKKAVKYSKRKLLFEDHVPDRVAAGPLLQNDGGIPDSSGEGVAGLRTQNG
jgi:hypothetical protein